MRVWVQRVVKVGGGKTHTLIGAGAGGSSEDLNRIEHTFVHTQIFKEILFHMEHDQQVVNELDPYCQKEYQGNTKEIKLIKEFGRTYQPSKAVW